MFTALASAGRMPWKGQSAAAMQQPRVQYVLRQRSWHDTKYVKMLAVIRRIALQPTTVAACLSHTIIVELAPPGLH